MLLVLFKILCLVSRLATFGILVNNSCHRIISVPRITALSEQMLGTNTGIPSNCSYKECTVIFKPSFAMQVCLTRRGGSQTWGCLCISGSNWQGASWQPSSGASASELVRADMMSWRGDAGTWHHCLIPTREEGTLWANECLLVRATLNSLHSIKGFCWKATNLEKLSFPIAGETYCVPFWLS